MRHKHHFMKICFTRQFPRILWFLNTDSKLKILASIYRPAQAYMFKTAWLE